ncbi:carbonic anhydrase [Glaciimonas soli]|uniref:Carbonic anhydrase n=1 Tax=Glaciimonas soli TaxID=2590999 RepID=A0A843YXJ7_9BURK|nr:carbonic anhydrase [Glaciimonas soli]MQR01276.1 carbonic anhydrase [Glaciimonas soli]
MCKSDIHTLPTRRRFLQLTGTSAVGIAALSSQLLTTDVFASSKNDKSPPKPQNILTPQEALKHLMAGNARYVKGVARRHDFRHEREALEGGQNPYAALLSCADSRIAPEYAFDSARGDIFAVRIAGNFVTDDGLGSLEYAVAVLNAPLIMVLGHDSCGAIDAAVKAEKDNAKYPGQIQAIADALKPAVQQVLSQSGSLLDNAIRQNVVDNVGKLQSSSKILSDAVSQKKLMIVGGVYKLATGKVEMI